MPLWEPVLWRHPWIVQGSIVSRFLDRFVIICQATLRVVGPSLDRIRRISRNKYAWKGLGHGYQSMTAKAQWYSMEGMRNRTKTNCLSFRSLFCYRHCTVSKKQGRNEWHNPEGRMFTSLFCYRYCLYQRIWNWVPFHRQGKRWRWIPQSGGKEGRMFWFTKACDLEGDTKYGDKAYLRKQNWVRPTQFTRLWPSSHDTEFGTQVWNFNMITKLGSQLAKLVRNTSYNSDRATSPNVRHFRTCDIHVHDVV